MHKDSAYDLEALTVPIFYGLTSIRIMMESNVKELEPELQMEVSGCVQHIVAGIVEDVDKLVNAIHAAKQAQKKAQKEQADGE